MTETVPKEDGVLGLRVMVRTQECYLFFPSGRLELKETTRRYSEKEKKASE